MVIVPPFSKMAAVVAVLPVGRPQRRPYSALNTMAVGVRAAIRPGIAATTLAKTRAPRATRITESDRHGGVRHRVDVPGKQGPQLASDDDPNWYANENADACDDRRLRGDGA
jgi:hypothetical protein